MKEATEDAFAKRMKARRRGLVSKKEPAWVGGLGEMAPAVRELFWHGVTVPEPRRRAGAWEWEWMGLPLVLVRVEGGGSGWVLTVGKTVVADAIEARALAGVVQRYLRQVSPQAHIWVRKTERIASASLSLDQTLDLIDVVDRYVVAGVPRPARSVATPERRIIMDWYGPRDTEFEERGVKGRAKWKTRLTLDLTHKADHEFEWRALEWRPIVQSRLMVRNQSNPLAKWQPLFNYATDTIADEHARAIDLLRKCLAC